MKAILIPVKEFHEAKKRLAPHFSPADRAALAEAMCEDFFSVVAATRCADRMFRDQQGTRRSFACARTRLGNDCRI